GTYLGIKVAGFGPAEVKDVSGVGGMIPQIEKLTSSRKIPGVRLDAPRAGDLMFWWEDAKKAVDGKSGLKAHVAVVTEVKEDGKTFAFASLGNVPPILVSNVTSADIQANAQSPRPYGRGDWRGFWTPV